MASTGISGVGAAAAAAGGLLMYAGIRDVSITVALRDIVGGKLPTGNRDKEGQPGPSATAARAVLSTGGGTSSGGGTVQIGAGGGFTDLARAALRYKGRPYRWGGTGPDAFDCSGLVMQAFADLGIKAPRTTYQQQAWRALSSIPAGSAAAGDLAFWPGHVAIMISAGEVIHAPGTGKTVKTAPVGSAGPRGLTPVFKRYTGGAAKPPKTAQV